jgi:hypothetical protein
MPARVPLTWADRPTTELVIPDIRRTEEPSRTIECSTMVSTTRHRVPIEVYGPMMLFTTVDSGPTISGPRRQERRIRAPGPTMTGPVTLVAASICPAIRVSMA